MEPLKLIDENAPIGTEVIYVSTFGPPAARMFRGRTASMVYWPGSAKIRSGDRVMYVEIRSGDRVMYVEITHVYVLPPPSDAELLAALGGVTPEHEEP